MNASGAVAVSIGRRGGEIGRDDSPKQRVVRDVIRGLYEGRYAPGQRLVEAQLTEHYGVSRGPVREALNHLAARGVIELMPGCGAQVRVLSVDDAIDILVVVEGLVGIAARLAANRIDQPGAEDRIRSAIARLTRFDQSSTSARYAVARNIFYARLTDVSGNRELARILPFAQIHLIRVQFRAVMRSVDRSRHADYVQIADAICSGQAGVAEAAARAHIQRSIDALSAFRKSATPEIPPGTRVERV